MNDPGRPGNEGEVKTVLKGDLMLDDGDAFERGLWEFVI